MISTTSRPVPPPPPLGRRSSVAPRPPGGLHRRRVPPRSTPAPRFAPWCAALLAGAVVGTALIGWSYARSTLGESSQYPIFYAGLFSFMLPAAVLIGRRGMPRSALLAVTGSVGLFLFIPKILRNPFGPIYHDELAHWRQTVDIATQHHLFVANTTIPIISSYPGLHIVTMTIAKASGLSIWGSALALIGIVHIVDLLAAFLIVETVSGSSRTGAFGALLFSLNPSFMYFDDQFGYETLAVMLFLLTILAVLQTERARTSATRAGWGAVAFVVAASCIITHHLSSVALSALLVIWTLIGLVQARRGTRDPESVRAVTAVTISVATFFLFWLVTAAAGTFTYLKPYLGSALAQLQGSVGGSGGSRTPFAAATNPLWERLGAFGSPLLTLIVAGITLLYLRRVDPEAEYPEGPRARAGTITLFLFGMVYFPSIPFLLAPSGAEGARRSWGFTYLGVAVIAAPTVARWLRPTRSANGWTVPLWTRVAVFAGFVAVMVGNIGAGLNPDYRFPGPYNFGADGRTITPEVRRLSAWFATQLGGYNNVVADRYTGLALGTLGQQNLDAPSDGFPTFLLYLNSTPPPIRLIYDLQGSDYRYLVIDKRMDIAVSDLSGFFSGGSDTSTDGTTTVTEAGLNRFAAYPWMSRVYESTDFVVYRFHFGDLRLPEAPQAG